VDQAGRAEAGELPVPQSAPRVAPPRSPPVCPILGHWVDELGSLAPTTAPTRCDGRRRRCSTGALRTAVPCSSSSGTEVDDALDSAGQLEVGGFGGRTTAAVAVRP
jgi:hypothetical protein